MVKNLVCISKSLFQLSSNIFLVIFVTTQNLYTFKSSLAFLYLRQRLQNLHLIPRVSYVFFIMSINTFDIMNSFNEIVDKI